LRKQDRVKGYEELEKILDMAYLRAAKGKGRERHANNQDFLHQPIVKINALTKGGFALGQVLKKAEEIPKLSVVDGVNEMLDVIVYAASWVMEKLKSVPQGGNKIETLRESGNNNLMVGDKKTDGEMTDWVGEISAKYTTWEKKAKGEER
jgi:hypothetical protein